MFNNPIRGQVEIVFRFLWRPVTICGEKRHLRFVYLIRCFTGERWIYTDFERSDVGKAKLKAKWFGWRKDFAYWRQQQLYKFYKLASRRTTKLNRKLYDQNAIVYRLEQEHALD